MSKDKTGSMKLTPETGNYGSSCSEMIQTSHLTPTNFSALDPDCVLNALESLGFRSDGRLLALNSYENRVYQVGRPGGMLVLKFYRPARWTDAQIEEEHRFTAELAEAEKPRILCE